MNVHQIITGALNQGESVFAVGSVEGVNFTACAVGCDIVILANDFQRVQIIPGCSTGYVQVSCIDCCHETGKIAAAFNDTIRIYEPVPLARHTSSHKLDYQWFEVSTVKAGSTIVNISWNLEGLRLLVSTEDALELYQNRCLSDEFDSESSSSMAVAFVDPKTPSTAAKVRFAVDDEVFAPSLTAAPTAPTWQCVWKHVLQYPIKLAKFSPDGTLFATCSQDDQLVKIWYQDCGGGLDDPNKVSFSFTYLPHPNVVVGFEWRKTGRYTPRGSVMNVLITWCRDYISRIWCETSLPAETCGEMLLELKLDNLPIRKSEKERVQRHSSIKTAGQRLAYRLKHLKKTKSKDRKGVETPLETSDNAVLLSQVPSQPILSDIVELPTVIHFHLAVSIHPDKDCFLVPSFNATSDDSTTFAIHWLNNKELLYSLCVEKLLAEALASTDTNLPPSVANVSLPQSFSTSAIGAQNGDLIRRESKRTFGDEAGNFTEKAPMLSEVSQWSQTYQSLDVELERLLREWQQSSDILFTIHPLDGSLLVWTVDFLDNPNRQPTVVFSSRLPHVFPLSDAASLNHNAATFNPHDPIYVDLLHRNVEKSSSEFICNRDDEFPCYMCNTIFLLTNHQNGTLNLWHLNVDEKSKFQQILSVTHRSRMCGHRYRINAILCHPVLPLFLTTSHHNFRRGTYVKRDQDAGKAQLLEKRRSSMKEALTLNSEMILWKVNPVGPLCKSGGVRELARINSSKLTAFSSIAWIPAILPSSTLGSKSNSPSSCFVAFDGQCLRVFQAVIDARALLAEVNYAKNKRTKRNDSPSSSETDTSPADEERNFFNIVSSQSTARPGCIIELDAIDNSVRDWKNVQLLHVYHEQMLFGDEHAQSSSRLSTTLFGNGIVIDRSKSTTFDDRFYLIALEKLKRNSQQHADLEISHFFPSSGASSVTSVAIIHVWLLAMSSQPSEVDPKKRFSIHRFDLPAGDLTTRDEYSSSAGTKLFIHSKKVCMQQLKLPEGVKILQACPTAGHLASSSLYPACRAPYLLTTACSDDRIRYWHCNVNCGPNENPTYSWAEWRLTSDTQDSSLEVDGKILSVSCAYSGRFACSFDPLNEFDTTKSESVNIEVGIYECESSGGIEWILEDRLVLNNIRIPRNVRQVEDFEFHKESPVDEILHSSGANSLMARIPSISNMSPGLRAVMSEHSLVKQDSGEAGLQQIVRLDWVSTEDGSYILTVSVGPKIFLFSPVSENLAQKNVALMHESESHHRRHILRKASTIAAPPLSKLIRWMNTRTIELDSADGLPALPLMLSWIREGILVVGMETEMRVYNQWNIQASGHQEDGENTVDSSKQTSMLSKSIALAGLKSSISPSQSVLDLKKIKDFSNKRQIAKKMPRVLSALNVAKQQLLIPRHFNHVVNTGPNTNVAQDSLLTWIKEEGLFEAARLATPLLPQYHPRLLMELMYAGKTRRVKAILLHVLRFVREKMQLHREALQKQRSSDKSSMSDDESLSRSRSLCRGRSDVGSLAEDSPADYIEIESIPPLPLHALLATEKSSVPLTGDHSLLQPVTSIEDKHYDDLFDPVLNENDLDDLMTDEINEDVDKRRRASTSSTETISVMSTNAFSAKHTRLLSQMLTHIHLPGLSSVDQMHLLAVSDTLSSFSADVMDKLSHLNGGMSRSNITNTVTSGQAGYASSGGTGIDSIDECGLRFLMALKQYEYLLLCLPLKQRAMLRAKGLATSYIIWALHSDSQIELLNSLSCMQKNTPKWEDLRTLGAGWWLTSLATLKICIEKVAKTAFQINNDPMDAAVYYLAMRKKNVIMHLYRSARDSRMMDFFANDFTQDKWKKAALKNAFVLMGKQRFEHAVAFFLLGDAFEDALQVCVNNLNDLQLALVIARLYEQNVEKQQMIIRKLLSKHILGLKIPDEKSSQPISISNGVTSNGTTPQNQSRHSSTTSNYEMDYEPSSDPFSRSMAYWLLTDYERSLSTLIDDKALFVDSSSNISEVFSFYVYLRTHPLVVRQRLLNAGVQISSTDRFIQVAKSLENQVTPLERKLYFKTASVHFKTGCPLLALEVLCKLPKKMWPLLEETIAVQRKTSSRAVENVPKIFLASSSVSPPQVDSAPKDTDWSFSAKSPAKKVETDELKLDWDDENEEQTKKDEKDDAFYPASRKDLKSPTESINSTQLFERPDSDLKLDIMAQQLKFIACLKIIMEELSTLASLNEVDGGQLRIQLYSWLEKEVDVLKYLCEYNVDFEEHLAETFKPENNKQENNKVENDPSKSPVLLHEALKVDRLNMNAKLNQSVRRRLWLAANQQLLRTLLSYCSLHSSQGVGLTSVRMEILLLLQELHQDPSRKSVLAAPLPVQSSFPLLAASVASIKTDIAGPLRYLHCQISDLLKSFCDLQCPPKFNEMSIKMSMFYMLSQGLSSCIYESLCDVDNLALPKGLIAGHGYLLRRKRRKSSSVGDEYHVTSSPHKWPGTENLLAYLSRERDEDVPNLLLLLAETWVAIYLALFAYSFCSYDSRWLYRLVAHPVDADTFSKVFGGGAEVKSSLGLASDHQETSDFGSTVSSQFSSEPSSTFPATTATARSQTVNHPSNLRARFNAKLFGADLNKSTVAMAAAAPNRKQSLITTKNRWIQPKMSIITHFMTRPMPSTAVENVYNSDASESDADDGESDDENANDKIVDRIAEEDSADETNSRSTADERRKISKRKENIMHADPDSFAWLLLRFAVVKQAIFRVNQFIAVCGFEVGEIGATSPLIHNAMRVLDDWKRQLSCQLDASEGGCPESFLPNMDVDRSSSSTTGPSLHKYRTILDSDNTPFSNSNRRADPVKRLWLYLVSQEHLMDGFIRYIFKARNYARQDSVSDGTASSGYGSSANEILRICQRELDPITAFAVSQAHFGWLVVSTPRELQEIDIVSSLTSSHDWLADPTEVDLASNDMTRDPLKDNDDYILISPKERARDSISGRSGSFLCKRNVPGVRRLESHPTLPYYISGSNDGSVRLWEFGVNQALFNARPANQFSKVTRTRFNAQGNKFGITDSDGFVSLWQLSYGMTMKKPFMNVKCHAKTAADFTFLGNSSSLLATAGYATGDANVALWDTLLPLNKSLIHTWTCHPEGSTTLMYVPQQQILLTGGRHGEICIFDVRERKLRSTIKAFDHATIKALAMQPTQKGFIVGSSDGDIKVFNLDPIPQLLYTWSNEHAAKGGFSLRQVSSGQVQGVQQLYIDSDQRMYSCGADCSLKIRLLKCSTPNVFYTTI